jgi:hypothetical protein
MTSSGSSYACLPLLTVLSEMMRIRPAKIVGILDARRSILTNYNAGGKIGHRKYDCTERKNFAASIICRVCGNAGHFARDCGDRPRGVDWRNPGGQGDVVDKEYEVLAAG